MPKFTLLYFNKQFPDDQACRKFLEQELWNNVPTCPYCGNQQKIYSV
ncbi:transposase [Alistipes sp. CLA-KB-H122]|uniref:Transposase n=1 Tax=Alistipes intestinihominis TaxID=3133172 RepID=A0ABV1GYM9_9BACT